MLIAVSLGSPATGTTDPRLQTLQKNVSGTSGVAAITPIQLDKAATSAYFSAISKAGPAEKATTDLVNSLRKSAIPNAEHGTNMRAYVGGSTAGYDDLAMRISSKLPLQIVVVIALSFVLLILAFRTLVVPAQAAVMNLLASDYVAGSTADDAFATAARLAEAGVLSSVDFFGENVVDSVEADRVADVYLELAGRLDTAPAGTFLSLDLSHLGLDEPGVGAQNRLGRIASAVPDGARVQVGAEQAARSDRILDAVLAVASTGAPVQATVQANLHRSTADAVALAQAGVPIRLVKGAYAEDRSIAHPWGAATDVAFVRLAHELHRGGADFALATHDPVLREALLAAMPGVGVEMLLGVRRPDLPRLISRGIQVRLYVPFGERWFRYAMRRLAESRGRE